MTHIRLHNLCLVNPDLLLDFCLLMELCVSNIWFKGEEKRKVRFGMGENETEIDLALIKKNTDNLCEMGRQSLGSFNMH